MTAIAISSILLCGSQKSAAQLGLTVVGMYCEELDMEPAHIELALEPAQSRAIIGSNDEHKGMWTIRLCPDRVAMALQQRDDMADCVI